MNLSQLFLDHIAQTSPKPMLLDIDCAKGSRIYTRSGKSLIDMNAGICVSALGHGHPKILEAINQQSSQYIHTMVYGEHVQSPQVLYAKQLSELLPDQLSQVYFTNSGSEATEGAMKLAKRVTGRYECISCENGYHGSTHGAESLKSSQSHAAYRPYLPGIRHIKFNDISSLENITTSTAAVFTEVIQAAAGVIPAQLDFLIALRKKCTEVGALLVFDEIQTGFGRTGKFFALEHYGVVPDILLIAKAAGGGLPLGALISSPDHLKAFTHHPVLGFITTFGGHPVCCAAGLAMTQAMIEEGLLDLVHEKANWIKSRLDHPAIVEIRNVGLMMAVEFENGDALMRVVNYCWENGVHLDWYLYNKKCMRIAPPLNISYEDLAEACAIIRKGMDQLL